MQRLNNIEFLRCFSIIGIVLFHMRTCFFDLHITFLNKIFKYLYASQIGVEIFFIIAGFFLFITFKDIPVWEFIKKKYFRLAPVTIFSILICAIASMFDVLRFVLIPNIIAGLLLSHFGIYWCRSANAALWFVSSLFFGYIVFFLIIKYVKPANYFPIFLWLGFGSYVLLSVLHQGLYNDHSINYYKVISPSTLRAFGGLGIGCLIGIYYKQYFDVIKNFSFNVSQKLICSIIELCSFSFIVYWFYFKHIRLDDFLFIIVFSILFICFLLKAGFISKITDKEIWSKLARYSFALFAIHIPIIRIIVDKMMKPNLEYFSLHPFVIISICLIIPIGAAIITYHFVEKPSYKFLSSKFLKENVSV